MKRRDIGILGERLARDFLQKIGYQVIESNYRCPHGEIDIIARDGDCLVFVEVRTRTSAEFGHPEESITRTKKERLRQVALHYQQEHNDLPPSWRIDVVCIELDRSKKPQRMEVIKDAVWEE